MEVKSINDHGPGRYIINYIVPTACGCSFSRKSLIVEQPKKPTEKEATKLMKENEFKNK